MIPSDRVNTIIRRIRWTHIKSILIGFLAMILSVIALAIILVTILAISKRELPIGPVHLLIPSFAFAAGCYWSLRQSPRPKALAKPSSNVTIVAKSAAVGVIAMIVSVIAFFTWILIRVPKNVHGAVGIDVLRAVSYTHLTLPTIYSV